MNITETPEKWVILKIESEKKSYLKIFATWTGDYLSGDSWRLNSGVASVKEDEDYFYFIGHSGSCYKCHKKTYGTASSYGEIVLNNIIKEGSEKISLMKNDDEWKSLVKFV